MIYFFSIITILLFFMLVGDKDSTLGESRYSGTLIASIVATALVYVIEVIYG